MTGPTPANGLGTAPGITVVLPVFMRDASIASLRLLREALDSVLGQEFPGPLELLVIDDGSPTPIVRFADRLGSAALSVRWLRHDRNAGLVAALNTGLREASHPLIARQDADDRWCLGKISQQIEQFAADPDLTISATGMVRVRPDRSVIETHVRPGDWSGILHFFTTGGCPFPHGSVLARRDVYRLLGGYPFEATFRHCEDYALWGTWLRFFKPAMVEAPLYEYLVTRQSMSSRFQQQQHTASQILRQRFGQLELADTLPTALAQLAAALGTSLIDAGRVSYLMWQNPTCMVGLPEAALGALEAVLPDRVLEVGHDAVLPWWQRFSLPYLTLCTPMLAVRASPIR